MYYIYLIVNKVNGKTYVGQRKSSKEWYEDKYMGSGRHLKAAQAKYGIENFEKFLIQYCYSKEETDKAEKFWIAEYRCRGKAEYNIADGGYGGGMKGKHHSEEIKRKISESKKCKGFSEDHRIHLSESHKGQIPWNMGKHHTEETKRKISEAKKGEKHPGYGKPNANKGKHWKLVDGKRVYY